MPASLLKKVQHSCLTSLVLGQVKWGPGSDQWCSMWCWGAGVERTIRNVPEPTKDHVLHTSQPTSFLTPTQMYQNWGGAQAGHQLWELYLAFRRRAHPSWEPLGKILTKDPLHSDILLFCELTVISFCPSLIICCGLMEHLVWKNLTLHTWLLLIKKKITL